MSTSAINMSHGAYMTHFCSHMPKSRRTQRMYVHLAFVNSSKTAVAYLPPTNSVWEFQLLHSFTDTWYYHLCVCLLNSSHSVEYALPSSSDFNVYFLGTEDLLHAYQPLGHSFFFNQVFVKCYARTTGLFSLFLLTCSGS